MRKLISILVALGLLVSFSAMATPVAAVEEGTVSVALSYPVACNLSDYCITFHNIGVIDGNAGDYIDIMFPTGTNVSAYNLLLVQKRVDPPPSPGASCGPPWGTCAWPAGPTVTTLTPTPSIVDVATLRLTFAGAENITKCQWVLISLEDIQNPTSCEHHLEVGTSAHTPVDSNPYTIYCAKIDLVGGKLPNGADKMNLISLPCYPVDTSIEVVLENLFCEALISQSAPKPFTFSVWYWDNENDTWLKYVSDSSFNDLQTIEAGKAYWIKPSNDIPVYVHGNPYPPGQGPPIKWCYPRCWNMVGFASLTGMNITDYLKYTKIGPGYTTEAVLAVWGWNDFTQTYTDLNWPFGPLSQNLTPGQGYWMAFVDEACIIPPAQAAC